MTVDTEELRRLAEAATPGPWFVGWWHGRCHIQHKHTGAPSCQYDYSRTEGWSAEGAGIGASTPGVEVVGGGYEGAVIGEANARFIAAANPAAVLALLERVRRLEEALREIHTTPRESMSLDAQMDLDPRVQRLLGLGGM